MSNNTKFTKAPWSIGGDWQINDSNNRLIAQFEPLNDELSNANTPESLANAQLIICAPEMYYLLDSIRQCFEWGYNEIELADELLGYKQRLIELLSKARA
jgi:hypothetical protein